MKEDFKIKGIYPPVIFTSTISDKVFAVTGASWIEIPNIMTLEEVRTGWTDTMPQVKQEDNFKSITQEWEVKSSKGDKTYMVTNHFGSWYCTCVGFGYRRKCRHVSEIKIKLKS